MNILAIDTSNRVMSIAIIQNGVVSAEKTTNIKRNHSLQLMPSITALMESIDLKAAALDKIVVAKGPGSFTGVRIGLTTAKTLAWTLNIPIVGVSSLEVLAYNGQFFDGLVCAFFDARRSQVYGGLYSYNQKKDELLTLHEANALLDDWLAMLKERNSPVLFLSPDMLIHKDAIISSLGDLAVIPNGHSWNIPSAAKLGVAAINKESESTHSLVPNYLRLAEAEAKWLEQQGNSKNV